MRKNLILENSYSIKETIEEEIWDVIYYALAIANCYDIDVESIIKMKEDINREKYNSKIILERNR
ncbi:NTP pyrophosphatase (non-canonical NTP hydrolase) [Sedimentibacter acidaminivorans]|uniref:NTP pyrophosphatase (Non-canonical NTP hydrolase) n=1 Tax=Sedimentibacter acidaminivorans TaxID=913099 RepID=A0ABS4GAF2_9FIRM|nr:hypothetical protein [Sedimentibacter acidaminivorans]MBP1924673.1 NTP pyrophosphatase (non-canonical NTP hydrolase) [Sedimentibacter acidaminivorans]